jgi:tRNA(His) 5'-end guanylyltransferase
MCSVSASIATMAFNKNFRINVERFLEQSDWVAELLPKYRDKFDSAIFDSRVFQVPKDEVNNYFVWRQQDCTRNAIQMLGQANFSHKELHGCSCNVIQEKLFSEKGLNFNDIETTKKRGACIVKETFLVGEAKRTRWIVDKEIPIFTQDRGYIEKFV